MKLLAYFWSQCNVQKKLYFFPIKIWENPTSKVKYFNKIIWVIMVLGIFNFGPHIEISDYILFLNSKNPLLRSIFQSTSFLVHSVSSYSAGIEKKQSKQLIPFYQLFSRDWLLIKLNDGVLGHAFIANF